MEPKVSVKHHNLRIKWQFSTIDIPVTSIKEVTLDDTYAGEEKRAIRLGFPYGHTDRVVIRTTSETYLLYTSNVGVKDKIETLMKQAAV